MSERHRRRLRGDGLGGRRGPGARGRVAQLRRAQPRPRPPGAHHAGHLLDRPGRRPPRAAHPHLAGAGAHHAEPRRRRSTSICPGRVFRTDEYDATHIAGVPPGRGARRRRGHHDGPPQGHPRPLRRSRCSATGIAHAVPPVVLPVHRAVAPRSTWSASSAAALRRRRSSTCRTCKGEGWIEWGGCGVVNPRVLTACGIDSERYTRLRLRHGHRPHADVPHTASRTCATCSRATSASPRPSGRSV